MTTLLQVTGDTIPDVLPRANIPFFDDCLGLWLLGIDDANSRKNRAKPAAPLDVWINGPVSFGPASAMLKGPDRGYVTPFQIQPRNYTAGVVATLNYYLNTDRAYNQYGGHNTFDWSPIGGDSGSTLPLFAFSGQYYGQSINNDTVDFTATEVSYSPLARAQQFMAFAERADGLDMVAEEGIGGGLVVGSKQGASTGNAAPVKLVFGARAGTGTADVSIAFAFGRPLTVAEMQKVYLFCRTLNGARGYPG